jgi:hypothetical protein
MKSKMHTARHLFFILLLSLTALSFATNMLPTGRLEHAYFYANFENVIGVEVANDSNFAAAANEYTATITIKDSGSTVFEEEIQGVDIVPYEKKFLYTTTPFIPGRVGDFEVTLEVDYLYDVNQTDDETSGFFPAIYSFDVMSNLLGKQFLQLGGASEFATGFVHKKPLEPGDTLSTKIEGELNMVIDDYSYLGYYDSDKYGRYDHYGMTFVIDAKDTTKIDSFKTTYWLELNGEANIPDYEPNEEDSLLYGSAPQPDSTQITSTVTDEAPTSAPGDSVCAILVSGEGKDASEQEAFNFDTELFSNNIRLESMGPRLPGGSVVEMNNPSLKEICDKFEAMKNNYKHVYFFFSGHGSKYAISVKDTFMLYLNLAEKLLDIGATDYTVVLDNCRSGAAIEEFKSQMKWSSNKKANVTLLAACDADTVSYTRYLHTMANGETVRVGAYTWALMLCWGEPAADRDGNGVVSLEEAYHWVKLQNPSFNGKTINEYLDPQLMTHRVECTQESNVSAPDTDVAIENPNPPETDATYRVTMETGIADFENLDDTIIDMSDYRKWRVETDMFSYSLNMEFGYMKEFEYLEIEGEPGIAHRDSAGAEWTAYPNVEYSLDALSIKALGVTKNYDWALADVVIDTRVVENDGLPKSHALNQNYPNPFNPSTTIRIDVPFQQRVSLKIFDILGRELLTLIDKKMDAGSHAVQFDASTLSAGMYLVRYQGDGFSDVKKMMLVK